MDWLRVDPRLLNDAWVQQLDAATFKREFYAASRGETGSRMARYVVPSRQRPMLPADLRMQIFERDDYTCRYCGERGVRLEADHVVPVSKGGSDDPANLVTACFPCNRSKGAKLLQDWVR